MRTAYFPLLGRFGNLLFIYAHARAWCEQNGYELCMDPWVGEQVFQLPIPHRDQSRADIVFPERMYQHQRDLIYTRSQVKSWFKWRPEVEARLQKVPRDHLVLNRRVGDDYRAAGLVLLGEQCYRDACHDYGYDINTARWESDHERTMLDGFEGNLSAAGVGTTATAMPSFYRLMMAPVLFRANSTFSWWAATLGNGRVYSPVIEGLRGGTPDQYAPFVPGNWPMMAQSLDNSDLRLPE